MNTTDYIEQTLEGLVRVHGLARVQRDLERKITASDSTSRESLKRKFVLA